MFIKCSKNVRFTHPENPQITWDIPPGFIGDVPNWVEKHWYFDALCNDGSITTIKSHNDRDIHNATDDKKQEEQQKSDGNPIDCTDDDKQGEKKPEEPPKQSENKKGSGGKK